MKIKLYRGIILSMLLLIAQFITAQDITQKVNQNKIIKASGDTLIMISIKTNPKNTNEDQLTYIKDKNTSTINSLDLKSYFDGTSLFYSENIVDQDAKKLINYIVTGPIILGKSLKKNGTTVFYIKKENDGGFIDLEHYQDDIELFLNKFLSDFINFKTKYNKKTYYDYKSLGEFAAAYNAYKAPETYVPLKFQNQEKIKFGLFCSVNLSTIAFDDVPIKYNSDPSFSIGVNFLDQYSRTFSLDILSSYNSSVIESKSEEVIIKTIGIETSIGISFYVRDYLCLKVDFGPALYYNLNSGINILDENRSVRINGLNLGYSLGMDLVLRSKYDLHIGYLDYNTKTNNFDPSGISSSIRKGKYSAYRIGFIYNFN